MIAKIAIGIKMIGIVIQITMNVPIIKRIICAASRVTFGNKSSIASMSFEKRLSILPLEFVSKNLIPDLINPPKAKS